MPAHNPCVPNYRPAAPNDAWRIFVFEFRDQSEHVMQMKLLRHLDWFTGHGFTKVGDEHIWSIPEISLHGIATLKAIDLCPALDDGNGSLVTGTFTRVANTTFVSLVVDGQEAPLVGTACHRMWSEDALAFKEMGTLRVGEKVRTHAGVATVCSVREHLATQSVYNIEVDGEHCFFAGDASLLVHNAEYGSLSAAPQSGPVAELGRKLAGYAKSLYAIAGEPVDESRLTALVVELKDGSRKVLVNGGATPHSVEQIKSFAKGLGVTADDVIVGQGGEHAEDVLKALYPPNQVKAVGVGQRPCDACEQMLITEGYEAVYWAKVWL